MTMHTSLAHLSAGQHHDAADLAKQVQDTLGQLSRIVGRAAFTDDTLRVQKAVQELLIDRLSAAWDVNSHGERENPYPSVGYGIKLPKGLRA